MKISKLIIDFLEYLEIEKNASQLTIRNYDHYLQRFLAFVGDINPKDINLELLRKYRVYLARYVDEKTGLSLKRVTQNYFIIALRAFLRYLEKIFTSRFLSATQGKRIRHEPVRKCGFRFDRLRE